VSTLLAPAALAALAATAAATERWMLAGGREVGLRPVAAADAAAEQAFFSALSLDSRHKRFHVGLRELSPMLLKLLTEVDQRQHVAWVVEAREPGHPVIADARYVHEVQRPERAEFALAVADDWQGRGLGRRLIAHLAGHARRHGVRHLYGDILADNRRMLALMREFGAQLQAHPDGPQLVRAVLTFDGVN
jgi:acetyltransferase